MAAPTASDLERLLAPIPGDAPAGVSLRGEGTYEKIREARREDDPTIPQGVWSKPLKVATWTTVIGVASEALEKQTKDLQLAAWLADAWGHTEGVAGAAAGLALVGGLVDRYWEGLFPLRDDGDDEARANVLEWLDDALALRLRLAKLGSERMSITFDDWDRAGQARSEDDGGMRASRELLLARVSMVGTGEWTRVHREITAAKAGLDALEVQVAARFTTRPTLQRIRAALRGMETLMNEILNAAGVKPASEEAPPMGAEVREGAHEAAPPAPVARANGGGPISSRAEAYERLTEAADYLLRTEPHSPVPYLVKRAITWGNMPLTELLPEFISSTDDVLTAHRLLGMRARGE